MAFEFNFSVGTSAQVLAALPTAFNAIMLQNTSPTASVALTFDGSTPLVNGAGFTLAPLAALTWHPPVAQAITVTAIASAAATPLTAAVD